MGSSSVLSIPAGQRIDVIINQIERDQKEDGKSPLAKYVDDGEGNHDLPIELQTALKSLLTHYGTDVDKFPRRMEVIDARRQRFYDRGYQYIYFNWSQCVFVPVVGGVVMNVGSDSVQMPRYCNPYNIFKPYRRNFSAVLSQNPPGVNFEPKNPVDALDIKVADLAQKYAEHYDSVNDRRKLQAKIARLFWTDGRVVGRTWHQKNGQKFGYAEPEEGAEREEIGEEVTELFGVLEAKCFPITANAQDELTGVIISDDPDIHKAKDKYRWIAEEINAGDDGSGETAFERNARIGILQGLRLWTQASDSKANLAERHWMYLRPCAFEYLGEEQKEALLALFPEGVRATFVGGQYAEAYPLSLDDELTVDHALDGDGMNRPSWGKDHVPVQDAFNNYRNMRQEYHDYGIPFTGYDTALLDGNSFREMVSQPGEFKGFTNPQPGNPLASYFFVPPAVNPPADLIAAEQDLRDALSQLVTAVQPALFGGQIGKEDRVGVYQMAREQAMGVMALPWGVMQGMFARFKYQAVLAAGRARREDEVLQIKPKRKGLASGKPISVTIADLTKGNFRAVPDTDSSFPATRAMRKAAYQEFMQAAEVNPLLAEAAQQPDNLILGAELEGLSDLDIPAARAAERQLEEIDQLLATGPVPPSQQQVEAAQLQATTIVVMAAAAQGQKAQPLPPEAQGPTPEQWADPTFIDSGAWLDNPLMMSLAKCSVPVKKRDFHKYHLMTITDWLNSAENDKQVEAGNRAGLANIELHAQEHEKFIAAQGPPPAPIAGAPA
jgi:hypothetical protein